MSVEEGPTIRRRRLGAELKRCREAAGLTQEQVSREFEWHAAKVTRIEAARVAVTPRDVKDLLALYGVEDREYRESLMQLARSGRERAWWWEYRDILRANPFIQLESDASTMRNWEPVAVPGLLQTEAYMRALFAVGLQPARIDRAVSLRLARQRRLTGPRPLRLFAVMDESVIHRRIGDDQVMAGQLRHLVVMSRLPTVDVRIFPYDAGEHALLGIAVAILEFAEVPDLDVVYLEQYRGTHRFVRQPAEVAQCRESFEELVARCLDQQETVDLIEKVAEVRGGSLS
ncbi:helix-turn-helix domain-containing protein [Paractinoplanes atraurantiacus]|uniref:Helix-turn-helix domain-containing protein n=1 Tax=Paractinoplanes atraurantiacus TaxID=1036182 RepID=A0A285K293_9ACTN|nr:helix-turn-helix transcriptional regulator [Actinoplanes atraurantiacus]SNY66700.1 Helix-turn-helix domain-containing protein [Actinoplanes atraurantiacus]